MHHAAVNLAPVIVVQKLEIAQLVHLVTKTVRQRAVKLILVVQVHVDNDKF